MRVLMLGNSFTFFHKMPRTLAGLVNGEVVANTRGGARLAEQWNPDTQLGAKALAALQGERWDYVVLQEMSHGPITAPQRFFDSARRLCALARESGATPVLYATWAYPPGGERLAALGMDCPEMARRLSEAYGQAARENGALLADVGQQFSQRGWAPELYDPDGLHPSPLGSQIAAQTIAGVLLAHWGQGHP